MIHAATRGIGIAIPLILAIAVESTACTSFMLETDQGLYFVHSLNQGNAPSVPGHIFINQRDVWKDGYSWASLTRVDSGSVPNLVWKSRYGSITFNPFGKELPDGGVNEAGLFIWEMSFDTEYPSDSTKPTLFQCQWMQYVLDNFSSTAEVIANASQMSLDGWGWHYFVADASGRTAIIDFVGGKPVVYTDSNMPLPLCCNSSYPVAMKWLQRHQGFGGDLTIQKSPEEIPRFIYGAKLLKEHSSQDPVEYAFHVLSEMSENVRWSVVYDVARSTAYYNTNVNQEIRHFTVVPADFGAAEGPLVLDIENPGPGDVRGRFSPYDRDTNTQLLSRVFTMLTEMEPAFGKMLLEDQGTDVGTLASRMSQKMETPKQLSPYPIQGDWIGTASYPSSDGYMELPVNLALRGEDQTLAGVIDDGVLLTAVSTINTRYEGGLLTFAIAAPDSPDLLLYQLYTTTDEIKGAIEISNTARRGTLHLRRVLPDEQQ